MYNQSEGSQDPDKDLFIFKTSSNKVKPSSHIWLIIPIT